MKPLIKVLWIVFGVFGVFGLFSFFIIFLNPAFNVLKFSNSIDVKLATDFGQFFGGFLGTIFTTTSTLLIILMFLIQKEEAKKTQCENHFFKMLDYHNAIVSSLNVKRIKKNDDERSEGKRAFVVFRMQLKELLDVVEKINIELSLSLGEKEIIDIAYIAFFYGIDEQWKDSLVEKLSRYNNSVSIVDKLIEHKKLKTTEQINISRTNETSLSSYFRNMYSAIKFVDDDKSLSETEKKKLIKIFRAQLSNPELYVFYLNISSRFGKNWIDKKLITDYELIKNIPKNYCGQNGKYDPKKYFPMEYEYEEY